MSPCWFNPCFSHIFHTFSIRFARFCDIKSCVSQLAIPVVAPRKLWYFGWHPSILGAMHEVKWDGILRGYSSSIHTPVHHTKSSMRNSISVGEGWYSVLVIFKVSKSSMRSSNSRGLGILCWSYLKFLNPPWKVPIRGGGGILDYRDEPQYTPFCAFFTTFSPTRSNLTSQIVAHITCVETMILNETHLLLTLFLSACNAGHEISEPGDGFPQDCSPCGEGRFAAKGAGSCTDCGINEDTAGSQTASECCEVFSFILIIF